MTAAAIQVAIYSALSGSATVTDLCPDVFDFGPSDTDGATIFPYIAMGAVDLLQFDTDTTVGFDAAVRIHTWANTGGALGVRSIQDAIYSVLHRKALSVSDMHAITMEREASDVLKSSSGAFHGVCDYRGLFDTT